MQLTTEPSIAIVRLASTRRAINALGLPENVRVITNPTTDDVWGKAVIGDVSFDIAANAGAVISRVGTAWKTFVVLTADEATMLSRIIRGETRRPPWPLTEIKLRRARSDTERRGGLVW